MLSDIEELEESSASILAASFRRETFDKSDRPSAGHQAVGAEPLIVIKDEQENRKLPMACAIISAPRVNQPAHQRTNQGVVLDISPPARPVTATRSIDFSQRSHAPKFTGSAVDRYRARSNVDAAIRSNTASSSSSQNEMASKLFRP